MIRRGLLWLAAIMALSLAAVCALIWNARRVLPFNAEGRYFDPRTAVVVHEQSVLVFAGLGIALTMVGVALGVLARRR